MIRAGAGAIPLVALDAVVLDTETTSLDPRQARIVQIGAIGMRGGRTNEADVFEALVDPGIPIPRKSTEIHGLADADLAGAPSFAELSDELDAFIDGRLIIGHNIGYDIAILMAEHQRAGLSWHAPKSLDIRLLAQLVWPSLSASSLEGLADRVGIEFGSRHQAMADARTTLAVFNALVSHLRQRNVRTLAEAEASCAGLTDALEVQHNAGWKVPERHEETGLSEGALARIDAYPYRHRIRNVMSAPPLIVPPETPMADALQRMAEARVSSLFVAEEEAPLVAECGILTERDLMRAMAGGGEGGLGAPISRFMSKPLQHVPKDSFLYFAIGRMARLRLRHLGVADEHGRLVGAISQRDLLRLRASEAISLGDEIQAAGSVAELAAAWAKLPGVAEALLDENVPAREIAAVISRELCAVTSSAAILAEARMSDDGRGAAPTRYALLVLGSGGRGESLLAADQDNAIVHADVAESNRQAVDDWFAALGRHVADILDACGISYCKGGIMAMNEPWRGSVSTWKARADQWVRRQRPEDLLNVDIFFDLIAVHGQAGLAREIRDHAWVAGRRNADFAKLMAEAAAGFKPPVGFFGRLQTNNGRLDLKKGGLFAIVAAARTLAIRHHVPEHSTPARLRGVRDLALGAEDDLLRLDETHALLMDVILSQQIADIGRGIAPSNKIEPARLTRRQMDRLKRGLKGLANLDDTVRDLLFAV